MSSSSPTNPSPASTLSTCLLTTKLSIPTLRPRLVPRPRLVERLGAGLDQGTVLVSAPAGFGKSTLFSDWHRSQIGRSLPLAWLSLDPDDDDLDRFWLYVVAALQTLEPDAAALSLEETFVLLQSQPPLRWQTVLAQLINELGRRAEPFALVLDNYHLIQRPEIHDGLTYLVEHRPPQMRVAIVSRTDPPLPLGRWRARGDLTEIRATDLRFSLEEAHEFLSDVMGLALVEESVARLAERTEGWIAGLQLAALSLQGRDSESAASFVLGFSGRHHYVLEYLTDEVLSRQSAEVRRFLLETSVLERLTGSLCDALSLEPGGGDSGASGGQSILEALDHANLFLVSLDDEHLWYRYHQLFQELLRMRLQQTWPDRVPVLHRRASEWHEACGLVAEAIRHALAAGDEGRADRLIDESIDSTLLRGDFQTLQYQALLGWLEAMPEAAFERRPRLQLCRALALIRSYQLDAAARFLDAAERCLGHEESDRGSAEPIEDASDRVVETRCMIEITRALILATRGEPAEALALSAPALERLRPDNAVWRGIGSFIAGQSYGLLGDAARFDALYAEARAIFERTANVGLLLLGLAKVAEIQVITGHLRQASESYDELLKLAIERGGRAPHPIAGAHAELAMLLTEWNDLDAALLHAEEALSLGRRIGNPSILVRGGLALARAQLGKGDLAGAIETCETTVQQAREHDVALYRSAAEALRARVWLVAEDLESASAWAARASADLAGGDYSAQPPPHPYDSPLATLARVRLALGQAEEAREIVELALPLAREAGRLGREIELRCLQALALEAAGSGDSALETLERALILAEPEGYVRTFLDEGKPLALLLTRLVSRSGRGMGGSEVESYARKLLAAFDGEAPRTTTSARPSGLARPLQVGLVEPLSEREIDVLRLLADGLTNQEIARRLYLSPNTVRAHTYNLYGKLGVHGRVEAANRGRRLGLLSA